MQTSLQDKVCNLRDDKSVSFLQTISMSKRKNSPKHFLAQWRDFRGMTQPDLADAVGTTKSVISLLESGNRGLSDKWLRRLAPALKTTPGAILDYDPNMVPTNILEIWASIPTENHTQAISILETFRRKAAS